MAVLNGRLDGALLARIPGTGRRCRADVMPQVAALRAAFFAHFDKPLVVTDAYRDFDTQVWLKGEKGVFAATPGTSNHGWGLAFDLGSGVNASITSREHLWMVEHAGAFGLFHPAWARDRNPANGQHEPWHWETKGAVPVARYAHLVPTGVTIPTLAGDPPAPLDQEDVMTPDQERALTERLDRALTALAGLTNAVADENIGLRRLSERAIGEASNAATISSDVRNLLLDPNVGVLAGLRALGDGGGLDAAALAAAIPPDIAREVLDMLTARLSA